MFSIPATSDGSYYSAQGCLYDSGQFNKDSALSIREKHTNWNHVSGGLPISCCNKRTNYLVKNTSREVKTQ